MGIDRHILGSHNIGSRYTLAAVGSGKPAEEFIVVTNRSRKSAELSAVVCFLGVRREC